MKKERFADEEMKELIKEINSGVLTIDEQTAVNVAIFEGLPVDESEDFTINEFGEIIRKEKKLSGNATELAPEM